MTSLIPAHLSLVQLTVCHQFNDWVVRCPLFIWHLFSYPFATSSFIELSVAASSSVTCSVIRLPPAHLLSCPLPPLHLSLVQLSVCHQLICHLFSCPFATSSTVICSVDCMPPVHMSFVQLSNCHQFIQYVTYSVVRLPSVHKSLFQLFNLPPVHLSLVQLSICQQFMCHLLSCPFASSSSVICYLLLVN